MIAKAPPAHISRFSKSGASNELDANDFRLGAESQALNLTLHLPKGRLVVKSKKICLVTSEFHGLFKNGGIGTANTGLALELAEAGWNVEVLYIDCDDSGPRTRGRPFAEVAAHYKRHGVNLQYLPNYPLISGQFRDIRSISFAIYSFVRAREYGAIFLNECGGQGFYTVLAVRAGCMLGSPKTVVVTHGPNEWTHDINSMQWSHPQLIVLNYMEKKCVEYADFVISPSEYLLRWMWSRNWVFRQPPFVEQNIVKVETEEVRGLRPSQPPTEIVFFGRQEVRKGVKLFCDAVDRLHSAGVKLTRHRITFLGKIWKIGEINSAAYILMRSEKWGAKVRFLSEYGQEEANAYLREPGRLAVIPSLAENSPCVVAECLQLNIPFIATNSGGTEELLASEDRTRCLADPTPEALASKIEACLASGIQPARLAVAQADVRQRWREFICLSDEPATAGVSEVANDAEPLVSICLVHYDRPNFLRQAIESVLAQTYQNLELVLIDDGSRQPESIAYLDELKNSDWRFPVKMVYEQNRYLGAARNAGTRVAEGEYYLFLDDDNLLFPSAVHDFVRAAQRFNADIVTGVPLSFYHRRRPNPEFDGALRTLPLGGCAEVGFFENCFGDANALVSRHAHAVVGGYHEVHGQAVEDWEFFAKAVLKGLKVEVLPKPTFWYRVLESGMFVKSDPVANARRIASVYAEYPIRYVSKMLELLWEISREQRFRMFHIISQASGSKESQDALLKLSELDPASKDAKKLLLEFMVGRRRVEEALDYALHNEMSLVEQVAIEARALLKDEAFEQIDRYEVVIKDQIDISKVVSSRIEALQGVSQMQNIENAVKFEVRFDTAILRAEQACPANAITLSVICRTDGAFVDYEACLIVCAKGTTIDLDRDGLIEAGVSPTSGWQELLPATVQQFSIVAIDASSGEPLDVFIIVRGKSDCSGLCELSWQDFKVELKLKNASGRSVVKTRFSAQRLPERTLAERAAYITRKEATPVDLNPFVPQYPATLHPIHGALAAVRLARIVPPGGSGARLTVSVGNEKSHAIQFGLWMNPASRLLPDERHLENAMHFSGWLNVEVKKTQKSLQLTVQTPIEEVHDLYIASRVVGQSNVWFCHALLHDLFVLYDVY